MTIRLRQLRYFTRTVEAGNITRAAEQLFVAQPALGMQIRELEQDLGVSLLSRHSRGVSPTRAGQVLYERACEVLMLMDDIERQVIAAGRHEMEGVVLGLTNGFMNMVGRDLILQARQALPHVQLSIAEDRSVVLLERLERHEIDVALAYEVHERPGLLRIPLVEEEMLFVSGPTASTVAPAGSRLRRNGGKNGSAGQGGSAALLARPIELGEVLQHELVLQDTRDGVRQQLLAASRRAALELKVMLDVSSISMMKNMVAHGDAAAVIPFGNAIEDIERGRLTGRRIINPPLRRTLYLVRSLRRAPFKHEGALLQLLAGSCRQFADRLGPMAQQLDALDPAALPLVEALAALRARAPEKP